MATRFTKDLFGGGGDSTLPLILRTAMQSLKDGLKVRDETIRAYQQLIIELTKEGRSDEIEEFEYKIDMINSTLTAAYKENERRIEHIKSLDTILKQNKERDRCLNDTLYWIGNWAWTVDSRIPIHYLPLTLFPKQKEYINWLERLVFTFNQSGLTEKSRDMGITWMVCCFIVKNFIFRSRFDVLVGSKSEEFVDKKGREDTLMEKMRFLLRMLPKWMLPSGFEHDKHMPWLNIFNPQTHSFIAGESANENFGRQGRYSFLFIDEFPIFPEGGYAAWTSCSASARAKLLVGTPKGKFNKFAELRHESKIRVFTYHWKDHPLKDDRWYRSESRSMTDAEKAQEFDINYDVSQAGRVYPMWDPLYHVITWSEFAAFFGQKAIDEDGRPRIPKDWLISCAQDVGITKDHRNVTTWMARPTERDRLADSVFLYRQYVAPIAMATSEIGLNIIDFERRYHEALRMDNRSMSHEAGSERLEYAKLGLDFDAWDTDYNSGIAQIRNYLLVIDRHLPHPFRSYLPANGEAGGNPIMGRPRWYVIVEDRQGLPKWIPEQKKWNIPEPVDDAGFQRARIEIIMYHIPETEAGKPARQQRPFKALDDAMDTWRALALNLPPVGAKTDREILEDALPDHLKKSALAKLHPDQFAMHWMTRQLESANIDIPKADHWRRHMFAQQKRNI